MALDPGNRTFMTGIVYTPTMVYAIKFGHGTGKRLNVYAKEASHYQSLVACLTRERNRLEERVEFASLQSADVVEVVEGVEVESEEVEGLREDMRALEGRIRLAGKLYNKSLLLVQSVKKKLHVGCSRRLIALLGPGGLIVLPRLDTVRLSQRAGRQVAHDLMAMGHGEFRDTLFRLAGSAGVSVEFFIEPYTTQCCPGCQECNPHIGRAKSWTCPKCRVLVDRDFNGARNILMLFTHDFVTRRRWREGVFTVPVEANGVGLVPPMTTISTGGPSAQVAASSGL